MSQYTRYRESVWGIMKDFAYLYWRFLLMVLPTTLIAGQLLPVKAQQVIYNPVALRSSRELTDTLSIKDIPTGEGGFARDYQIRLESEDQVAIDLISEDFDTMVMLISSDGSTVAENDDGPDGSTNSLLFARISEGGDYIIRVRAFGETGGGSFKLKITRLRPIEE